jgi:hypothetical protein
MSERFTQKRIVFDEALSSGKLKVSTLVALLNKHPYQKDVIEAFKTDEIKDEFIVIDLIDTVHNRIKLIINQFERFSVLAHSKDITIRESAKPVADIPGQHPLIFNFAEYVEIDEVKTGLDCCAIYDSKNTFFDEYDMAKYANRLYKNGLAGLAEYNINFFKALAAKDKRFNKHRSYRLVANNNELFLRGITSTDRYFEYGIDFTFVVTMLILHKDMKTNEGNHYAITSAAVSESKLELIISDKLLKDAKEFGKVSSAMIVTTNDLGQGSLNFTKIIRVGGKMHHGIYLFPTTEEAKQNKLIISHSTGPKRALSSLNEVYMLLNDTDEYIKDLHDVNGIKAPDELRARIVTKLSNPRSAFKDIQQLRDIFKTKIDNEIKAFAKLLEMCNKAEELEIDYDLKDKLRYIISDIILSGKK